MEIVRIVQSIIEGERDVIANLANTSAVLWEHMPRLNWVGFYIVRQVRKIDATYFDQLVLGPFQGKPACIRINIGRGVCGAAAASKQTIVVPNVDEFADHIVCDGNSKSEIVTPIIVNDKVVAVLDIDSPELDRFSESDAQMVRSVAELLAKGCAW